MTNDQLQELFQEGVQFNVNVLQAGQGSGLGLYISKGIVKQHGESLVASSDGIGLGTTFTMRLPLYEVSENKLLTVMWMKKLLLPDGLTVRFSMIIKIEGLILSI